MRPDFKKPQSEEIIRNNIVLLNDYDWVDICKYQQLSESFIREFNDKIDWLRISEYQNLSESFIREFNDKVYWSYISIYQNLSESFIRGFQDKLNWYFISVCQNLSDSFIKEFSHKINKDHLPNKVDSRSDEEKLEEIQEYANERQLEFKDGYLYAFRNHTNNKGVFNGYYPEKGIYKDWKCDLNPEHESSYGLGIFPEGNTEVKVHYKWWGTKVNDSEKARVWAFEMI